MSLASISIKRPTFISSIIVVMLVVGLIFMNRMSVDMYPDVNFPFIGITTIYPGAGPQEMEILVSKIIEEQVSSISGLKDVNSVNMDGVSMVFAEFTMETNPQYAEQQIKDKLSQVRSRLPKDIMEPIVRRHDPTEEPVMTLSLTADLPPVQLFDLANTTIKNGLEQVPKVSSVDIIGGVKREIHIDLDRFKLKEYETSIMMVAGRIAQNSSNIPIGKITQGQTDLTFRTLGEFRSLDQINNVAVSMYASDVPVTVRKLGQVTDATQELKTIGYLNGRPALIIQVTKQSNTNTIGIADNLKKRMQELNDKIKSYPGNPKLNLVRDGARTIRYNVDDTKITIYQAIILAIIVVYLFLGNFRSTFITIMALPNSLIGAFIFMYLSGFNVNMLTMIALSLAVGLLLDDAIVVRENIFRHIEAGKSPKEAALIGTHEVTLAVIATTLTVIAVFLPVGFLQGLVGQFFKQFGLTMVYAMSISLFDALTIAPMLSAYFIGKIQPNKKTSIFALPFSLPVKLFDFLYSLIEKSYLVILRFTLKHKLLILISSFIVTIASLGLIYKIPKTFMPPNEFGEFMVYLQSTPGTSLEQMNKYALVIDDLIRKHKEVELVSLTVGNNNGETNLATFLVRLIPEKKRKILTADFKEMLRKKLMPYKNTLNPKIGDISMGGERNPFAMVISGENLEQLAPIANQLIEKFKKIPGLVDLDTNYKTGKPEFQIKLNPEKMVKLNVQSITAGTELRGMVEGIIPAKYRENGMEYDIRVRLKPDQRDLSKNFNNLYVPNVSFQLIKLRNIAEPIQTTGPTQINRRNRSRYILITANLDKTGAIGDITAQAKRIMSKEKLPSGVTYEFTGSSEEFNDLIKNMIIAGILSIIFIYLVLASLYESLIIPFTIMLALPLAIVGALAALYITNLMINLLAMIGFIMLLGIVTKNSILLVDYTQRLIRQGHPREEALVIAAKIRLRPILMTTFALIAGMIPIALGLTEVGTFRMAMGVTVIGGLISSTILTLLVVPAVFGYLDQFRIWTRKLFGRPELREIDITEISVDKN